MKLGFYLKKPIGNYTVSEANMGPAVFAQWNPDAELPNVSRLPKPRHGISWLNIIAKET